MTTRYEKVYGTTRKNTYIKDFRIVGKGCKTENFSIELANGDGTYEKITERETMKESMDYIRKFY